ncbi:MAG: hypothetical protein F6K30_22755 [Cyanothece sp. SIO2G6]|nr:hypothetical protein [Cyanothece sp. SIO2G6]
MADYRKILPIAEYISVSASVVGTVAAIATQQVVYAIAPLSLSALLNLTNRRQTEQQIEQQIERRIGRQIEQQLQHTVDSVNQIAQRLHQIRQQHDQFQQDWQTLRQALEQAQSEQAAIAPLLVTLETTFNQQIADLRTDIQGNQTRLSDTEQLLTATVSELEFRAEFEPLAHDLQQLRLSIAHDLQQIQLALDTVTAQLETKVEAQVFQLFDGSINQTVETLAAELHTLQGDRQSQESITNEGQATLQSEITDQSTRLMAEIHAVENGLRTIIERLDYQVKQLRQRLEQLLQPLLLQRQQPDGSDDDLSTDQLTNDFSYPIPQLPMGDDFDLELNLGIDFGTGFTKVCFRDLAQEQAEIVTFVDAEFNPQSDPLAQTLIPTKIAILVDGRLLTGLTVREWETGDYDIGQSIEFIKMRLAALDFPPESGWRLERMPILDDAKTVESLCAYYLSQVIRRAQQWIEQTHPDQFLNQRARWSVNVGVPVEYCDSPALARFQRVLNLAWVLQHTPVDPHTLTLETLTQLTAHLQQWMEGNAIANLDCQTTPEIAAAVWSFLSSREAENGFYTFFDVGDGTLDGAAFWFERDSDGNLNVDFYKGQVEPLGVTAFCQQAATELKTSPSQIRQWLQDSGDQTLKEQLTKNSGSIRRTIQKLVGSVVMQGKEKHESSIHAPKDIGQPLRTFVGGGGGTTLFFRQTIADTHTDFKQGNAGVPAYQIKDMRPPKNLAIHGIDPNHFNRFAVAYGLCIPEWEGPTIRLPSQVPPNDATPATDFGTPPPKHDMGFD